MSRPGDGMGYHHGDLKQALLDAAVSLLADGGVEGLSLRKVAKAAGVSHAAPYHHFADKAEILRSLAIVAFTRLEASMVEQQALCGEDPWRRLYGTGVGYLLFAERSPHLFSLMWNRELCPMDKTLEPTSSSAFMHLYQAVDAVLKGNGSANNAIDASMFMWSHVHGIAMLGDQHPVSALNTFERLAGMCRAALS